MTSAACHDNISGSLGADILQSNYGNVMDRFGWYLCLDIPGITRRS